MFPMKSPLIVCNMLHKYKNDIELANNVAKHDLVSIIAYEQKQ